MIEEPKPCIKCKKIPEVVHIDDLWYVRCKGSLTHKGCNKWPPYEFLGATRNGAVRNWNIRNTRGGPKDEEI